MNWTGGSLSRSRKQNSNLTVIQKKHFAKARAQLLNGRPSQPHLDATIFGGTGRNNRVPSLETTPDRLQEQQSTQLTLDEFENVRLVVKQLQSLRPRHARNTTARPRATKSVISSQSPRQQLTKSLLATDPSRHVSASTQRAMAQATNANTAAEVSEQDELETKRRDLLGTSDWMGLERLKPVRIKFPDVEDRDLIGKRRRLKSDQYQAVPATNQYGRPIINPYEKLQLLQGSSNTRSSPEKISIHIGSSDRASPTRRRGESDSGPTYHQIARASQEMLFDDRESIKAALRGQTSTPSSLQQSMNTSDEMLFDREWSGIASPLGTESTGLPKDSDHKFPNRGVQATGDRTYAPVADTESGRTPSEYPQELQHARKDLEGDYDPNKTGLDRDRFRPEEAGLNQKPSAPAPMDPVHSDRRAIAIPERISGQVQEAYAQPRRHLASQSSQERRSLGTSRKANSHHPSQLSTAHPEKRSNGQTFAQATARDLSTLFPSANNPHLASNTVKEGEIAEDEVEAANSDIHDNHTQTLDVPAPTVQSPPAYPQDPATVPADEVPSRSPPEPLATQPAPRQQSPTRPPTEPTPDDEEIIWRTFVFGTGDPENDWTFDEPIQIPNPPPRPPISSPLQPIFNTSPHTNGHNSSPIPQTQHSLLAEASSASSSSSSPTSATNSTHVGSSSPARPQPLPSTIADIHSTTTSDAVNPPPSSGSPANRTQLSIQAQATSSDELALSSSPQRILPPPVTFRKPRRYVGESASPVEPVRLGVNDVKGKRGGGKKKEDDAAYGESGRGRKGRRDWRSGVEEVMMEEEGEGDEIVD
ncbi:MAG: hypothetical protein Q9188_000430 [Gyalolechia gomerana]